MIKFLFSLECDKICSYGQRLDTSLCQCRCEFSVVQGRVLSSSGAPLHNTRISLDSSPYTELTNTNKSGHFTIERSCGRLSYMVTRTGYIPQLFESGTQPNDRPVLIFLDDAGLFLMNEQLRFQSTICPFSKVRLIVIKRPNVLLFARLCLIRRCLSFPNIHCDPTNTIAAAEERVKKRCSIYNAKRSGTSRITLISL